MTEPSRPADGASDPPALALLSMITGKWVAQALYVAAKLGIADMLVDGHVPCDELARANQVDERSLYRVLRALASLGVFNEVTRRRFGLTPMSQYLRSDVNGSLRGLTILMGEEWTWKPWGDLLRSVKTGDPAFSRAYDMSLFDYFQVHPSAGAIFDQAMTGISEQSAAAVAAAYDFSGIDLLVDVGGGHGALISAILKANSEMRGILFDQPGVVEGATKRIEDERLLPRCQIRAGDFFEGVPEGGQAYVLRHIIHDWEDLKANTILENCRKAMAPNGRVLLIEAVIPPGDAPHFGKLLDLEMLVMATGRERTEPEYRDLLSAAGFRLSRVVPTATYNSVIEGVCA
ncbi:MAG TPA: methyltransferase [Isosphaeraceae bacterium]|nr:methyltransferase [Isosphaeraceae bacterium]